RNDRGKPVPADGQTYIEDTLAKFQLNEEQERAFRIIANHAASKTPEQLKMYIGGMGGTEKKTTVYKL
ncbi:hypothetical protein MPER_03631, partial [Moniliophthora perniciosa FA553]